MIHLLDTNVVSEMRRLHTGRADRGIAAWLERQSELDLYLSVITVMELQEGVLRLRHKDPFQSDILERWLQDGVLATFKGRILDVDTEAAITCAGLCARYTCELEDALIAAIALRNRTTLVTRNVSDFEPLGVRVINPWAS